MRSTASRLWEEAAYAVIAEGLGYGKVSRLLLLYFQPQKEVNSHDLACAHQSGSSALRLEIATVEIDIAVTSAIPKLLREARALLVCPNLPIGRPGCKDCQRLDRLIDMTVATACT